MSVNDQFNMGRIPIRPLSLTDKALAQTKELLIDNLDNWLECQRLDSELSNHTLNTYRNSINKFINYLSTNNLDTFDKDILIGYKKHLDLISNSVKSKNLWI